MSGLKTKRIVWTVIFLSITLAAIVMEVVAGVWHPMGTIPWTEYIATYVPWPVQLVAYVVLAVWLPFHFWRANDKRQAAYDMGLRMGRRLALGMVRNPLTAAADQDLADEVARRGLVLTRDASGNVVAVRDGG